MLGRQGQRALKERQVPRELPGRRDRSGHKAVLARSASPEQQVRLDQRVRLGRRGTQGPSRSC
jgi:hypothetical protein